MEEFSFPSISPNQTLNHHVVFPSTSIWLLSPSQPIPTHFRRSFSSADGINVSPTNYTRRDIFVPASPALSDFGIGNHKCAILDDLFDDEEERMDSLWEQFQNYEVFIDSNYEGDDKEISRRRSVGVGLGLESMVKKESIVASKSMRHGKKPNLVVMLRVLKKWFVNQGSKNHHGSYNSKRKQ